MIRKLQNANKNIILKLLQRIEMGISSMIHNYSNLYNNEELKLLNEIMDKFNKEIKYFNDYDFQKLTQLFEYENLLRPYAFRCWENEITNGNEYISWFKNDKLSFSPEIISSTFSKDTNNTFCNARYGIKYNVIPQGFLGACEKDASTVIEDASKASIYTIGYTLDGKVINSYNLATPIITPVQTFDKSSNDYPSKHNEIILDSKYVEPVSVIYTNEDDIEMVNKISMAYNLPIEYRTNGYIKN